MGRQLAPLAALVTGILLVIQAGAAALLHHAIDGRTLDPWWFCVTPWLVMALAARLPRRGLPGLSLGLAGLALSLSCAAAIAGKTTASTIAQGLPLALAPLPVLLAALSPWLARRLQEDRRDSAYPHTPALSPGTGWLALGLTTLVFSGAPFQLPAPAAAAMGAVALLLRLHEGGRLPRWDLLGAVALATLTWCAAATVLGHDTLASRPVQSWLPGAIALSLAASCRRPDEPRRWSLTLGVPCLTVLLIACVAVIQTAALAWHFGLASPWQTRLTVFAVHPNFLAPGFAWAAVVVGALTKPSPWRWLLVAVALTCCFWTHSRGAQLALLLALPLMFRPPRQWPGLPTAFVLTGALGAVAWVVLAPEAASQQRSLDYRQDAWSNAWQLLREHPWFGVGPHTFLATDRFQAGSRFFNQEWTPHAHGILPAIAQGAGWPALLGFILWIAVVWRRLLTLVRQTQPFAKAALLGLVVTLGAGLFDIGLSQETLIPWPLLLVTALLLPRGRQTAPGKHWPATAATLFAVAALVPLGWGRLSAQALLDHARLAATTDQSARDRQGAKLSWALKLDSGLEEARWLAGTWRDDPLRAETLLAEAVARWPNHGPAWERLGTWLKSQERWEQAALAFERAADDPRGANDHVALVAGQIESLVRVGDLATVREILIREIPRNRAIVERLGALWQRGDDGDLALVAADQGPLLLSEVLSSCQEQLRQAELAGTAQGRRRWLHVYDAWRRAGDVAAANTVLDEVERWVESMEPATILAARASLARDLGDEQRAAEFYSQAHALSGSTHYETLSQKLSGELPAALTPKRAPVADILAAKELFRKHNDAQLAAALRSNHPAVAARVLQRQLFFLDELPDRVRALVHGAELYAAANQLDAARQLALNARQEFGAHPIMAQSLSEGALDDLAGRIGRSLVHVGAEPSGSSDNLTAPVDLELLRRAGPVDQLLSLALTLRDRDNGAARVLLAELTALSASGETETLATSLSAARDRRGGQQVVGTQLDLLWSQEELHLEDPLTWWKGGTLYLLQGDPKQAAELFEQSLQRMTSPIDQAIAASWQAIALELDSRPGDAAAVLRAHREPGPNAQTVREQRLAALDLAAKHSAR